MSHFWYSSDYNIHVWYLYDIVGYEKTNIFWYMQLKGQQPEPNQEEYLLMWDYHPVYLHNGYIV